MFRRSIPRVSLLGAEIGCAIHINSNIYRCAVQQYWLTSTKMRFSARCESTRWLKTTLPTMLSSGSWSTRKMVTRSPGG